MRVKAPKISHLDLGLPERRCARRPCAPLTASAVRFRRIVRAATEPVDAAHFAGTATLHGLGIGFGALQIRLSHPNTRKDCSRRTQELSVVVEFGSLLKV